jgi:hypothetical protein
MYDIVYCILGFVYGRQEVSGFIGTAAPFLADHKEKTSATTTGKQNSSFPQAQNLHN